MPVHYARASAARCVRRPAAPARLRTPDDPERARQGRRLARDVLRAFPQQGRPARQQRRPPARLAAARVARRGSARPRCAARLHAQRSFATYAKRPAAVMRRACSSRSRSTRVICSANSRGDELPRCSLNLRWLRQAEVERWSRSPRRVRWSNVLLWWRDTQPDSDAGSA